MNPPCEVERQPGDKLKKLDPLLFILEAILFFLSRFPQI